MKKALITGISGFAGSFLAEHLLSTNTYEVSGTYLTENSLENVSDIATHIHLSKVDLTKEKEVDTLIATTKPDYVFHLAALPSPSDSFKNPSGYLQNNINAELFLLEALKNQNLTTTRTLIVASSEEYGLVSQEDLPIDEDTPLRPVSPYGVSKIAQDFLGLQYHLSYMLDIVRVRPFGQIGPRLSPNFAPSIFSKKIAEIEKGIREPVVTVGNLDSKRDFTNVKDMVEAYRLLLEKGESGEVYNAGSGASYKISDILQILLSMSSKEIKVQIDQELLRPQDIPELRCDNSKITKVTGWIPKIPIEQTLKEILDYWRGKV